MFSHRGRRELSLPFSLRIRWAIWSGFSSSPFAKGPGASADFPDEGSEVLLDDDLPQPFMCQAMGMEKIIVEKMTKRTMPDVMSQGGHP